MNKKEFFGELNEYLLGTPQIEVITPKIEVFINQWIL